MAKGIKKIIPETVELPLEVLEPNAGQLEGVPANPRTIKKEKFELLKQSLKDDPEMLGYRPLMVYPHGEKYIIIGGNMRYAAAKAIGMAKIPCIITPTETTEDKLRAYAIKDNNGYGEWDWDMLANEWDEDLLKEWGLDFPDVDAPIDADEVIDRASVGAALADYNDDTNYNLANLYRAKINPSITDRISEGVNSGEIRPQIAEVLMDRAAQCKVFNFDELIKFYRSDDATETEKELLKRLYLVFITPRAAFENGMLKLRKETMDIYDDELMSKDEKK